MPLRPIDLILRSIRGRLTLLVVAVVIPAAVLAVLLIVTTERNERAVIERQLSETARALSLMMDRQLGQSEAVLRALTTSPDLEQGNLAAFHRQATMAAGDEGWIVLVTGAGEQLVNTRQPFGTPLPAVSAPPEFVLTLLQGQTYVSNLLPGPEGEGHVMTVVLPVLEGGEIRMALAMVLPPAGFSTALRDQNLPPEWIAAVLDRNGRIVGRSRQPEAFVGALATEDLRELLPRSSHGVIESVTLEGVPTLAAYSRSPNSGWAVVVGAPIAELRAMHERLLVFVIMGALLLAVVGSAMSAWVARGVVHSVEALVARADALGRGEVPAADPTDLHEADTVAEALREAALNLRTREYELTRLNETLEARVVEATETLVQARKLEAIGLLTGGIAHDFNNLLLALRIHLDLLEPRVAGDEKAEAYVRGSRQAVDRSARLIAQLLAFARKQKLDPEPLDLNEVVGTMGELLHTTLGRAVTVETTLAPGLPPTLADRTQLELIVMNLAINARDAMDRGGVVRIETGEAHLQDLPSRPEHPDPGHYGVVCVADQGSGMTPEVQERIFEPFFTTKGIGRGSGLGLPQVLGIVKQLGGGLRVDSEPGRGTRFRVYLPVAHAEAAPPPEPAPVAPLTAFADLAVLLVDDDPDARAATAALLETLGCTVHAFADGAAALEHVRQGARPDVALLDYAMPGLTGTALAERLTVLRPTLPLILMSGFVDVEALGDAWTRPILQKPFSRETLAACFTETLGTR